MAMLLKVCRAGHDEARGAETTLLRVVVNEGRHHRAQLVPLGQTLDSRKTVSLSLDGQYVAGINRLAVHDHRTRTANTPVADALSTSQVEVVAQSIQQRDARL